MLLHLICLPIIIIIIIYIYHEHKNKHNIVIKLIKIIELQFASK